MNELKLNIGSRNNFREGYLNIDFSDLLFEDDSYRKMDVMDIDLHFKARTVDEIYTAHFMEHLTDFQITNLMYKFWCLLKKGGKLIIITPDFYNLLMHYKKKHQDGDFTDVDILHIKVFDVEEETNHKTVWYEEIGRYYLERENYFAIEKISWPSTIEIKFEAIKI